jgi:hypothetical protein
MRHDENLTCENLISHDGHQNFTAFGTLNMEIYTAQNGQEVAKFV